MPRGNCSTVKSAGLIFVFAAFIFAQSRRAHLEADRGRKIGNDFVKAALRALKAIESDNSMPEDAFHSGAWNDIQTSLTKSPSKKVVVWGKRSRSRKEVV